MKKIIALLLSLLMILPILASCDEFSKKTLQAPEFTAKTTASDETTEAESSDSDILDGHLPTDSGIGGNGGGDNGENDRLDNQIGSEFNGYETYTPSTDIAEDTTDIYYEDLIIEEFPLPDSFQGSDIPEDVDYGGYGFKVLVDTNNFDKEFVTQTDGDLLKDALYNRQEFIEDYVNISFNLNEVDGGYYNMESLIAEVEAASVSGEPFDLVLAYNLIPPIAAAKGLSKDLLSSTALNLNNTEKEYWGGDFRDSLKIADKIFWVSDTSSYNNVRNMLCVFVNTEIYHEEHGKTAASLYSDVDMNSWTMEGMLNLVQNTYTDTNANGVRDTDDTYGLNASENNNVWLDMWFNAAGFKYVKKHATGYDWALGNQEAIDFIVWWQGQLKDSNVNKQKTNQYKMFEENRAMFAFTSIATAEQLTLETDFTILPAPKYNENIKNAYSTPMSNGYTSYFVPKAVGTEDFERSTTVLELLAAEANRRITPIYFATTLLNINNTTETDTVRMFNIIRNSVVFDIAVLYAPSLTVETSDSSVEPHLLLRRAWEGVSGYESFATVWINVSSQAESKLDALISDVLEY